MKQVLSQQEIDSLLQAVESGEIDAKGLDEQEQEKTRSKAMTLDVQFVCQKNT